MSEGRHLVGAALLAGLAVLLYAGSEGPLELS